MFTNPMGFRITQPAQRERKESLDFPKRLTLVQAPARIHGVLLSGEHTLIGKILRFSKGLLYGFMVLLESEC